MNERAQFGHGYLLAIATTASLSVVMLLTVDFLTSATSLGPYESTAVVLATCGAVPFFTLLQTEVNADEQ